MQLHRKRGAWITYPRFRKYIYISVWHTMVKRQILFACNLANWTVFVFSSLQADGKQFKRSVKLNKRYRSSSNEFGKQESTILPSVKYDSSLILTLFHLLVEIFSLCLPYFRSAGFCVWMLGCTQCNHIMFSCCDWWLSQ